MRSTSCLLLLKFRVSYAWQTTIHKCCQGVFFSTLQAAVSDLIDNHHLMSTDQQVIYVMFNVIHPATQLQLYHADGRYSKWFHLGYLSRDAGLERRRTTPEHDQINSTEWRRLFLLSVTWTSIYPPFLQFTVFFSVPCFYDNRQYLNLTTSEVSLQWKSEFAFILFADLLTLSGLKS